jgi:hypothetical protein
MNTTLWVIQALLSAFFVMPGLGKVSRSRQRHIEDGHIKPNASIIPLRILGVLELLGCVGIIMPWLTGIFPLLTPLTALCFCLLMGAALVIHMRKKEYKMLPMLIFVFMLSAIVAYYRFDF